MGLIDSGVGVLSVLEGFRKHFPNLDLFSFSDIAHMPYGSLSDEKITQYSLHMTDFLLKKKVQTIIIACNTITSVVKEKIEEVSSIKTYGVIDFCVEQLLGTQKKKVAIIGTEKTIEKKIYENLIHKKDPSIHCWSKKTPLLAPLVEYGASQEEIKRLMMTILKEMPTNIQVMILGCTHYHFLKETIQSIYPEITLINSSLAISEILSKTHPPKPSSKIGQIKCYTSRKSEILTKIASRMGFHDTIRLV